MVNLIRHVVEGGDEQPVPVRLEQFDAGLQQDFSLSKMFEAVGLED